MVHELYSTVDTSYLRAPEPHACTETFFHLLCFPLNLLRHPNPRSNPPRAGGSVLVHSECPKCKCLHRQHRVRGRKTRNRLDGGERGWEKKHTCLIYKHYFIPSSTHFLPSGENGRSIHSNLISSPPCTSKPYFVKDVSTLHGSWARWERQEPEILSGRHVFSNASTIISCTNAAYGRKNCGSKPRCTEGN